MRYLRNDELTVAEAGTLPAALGREWTLRRGDELIKLGRADEALELFDIGRSRHQIGEPPWLAQAYCEDGRWSEYWSAIEHQDLRAAGPTPQALWRSGRYAALNAHCSDDPAHWISFCRELAALSEPGRPFNLSRGELVERAFLELLAATAVPGTPQFDVPLEALILVQKASSVVAELGDDDLFPVDQLRRMQLWLAGWPSRRFTLTRLAGLMRPDPKWVEQFARLVGLDRLARLDSYLDLLRDLAKLVPGSESPSIDTLLGETTLRIVRLTADKADVLAESVRDNVDLLWRDNESFSVWFAALETAAQ